MKILATMCLALVCSTPTFAQTSTSAGAGTVDDQPMVLTGQGESRVVDKKFIALGAALGTTMALDTKSTFDVLNRCDRCFESNPYAAPFIERGPTVAFTSGAAFDLGVMVVAGKMKGSSKPQLRKIWWLVPAALAAGHAIAYRGNLRMLK